MTKTIDTLVEDIYDVLDSTKEHTPDDALADTSGVLISGELVKATQKRITKREVGRLWASDLGKKCLKQHWYNFNMPEKGEKLSGNTKFKFLYGNVLEEAVLYFAKESGHVVSEPQTRVEHEVDGWTISGRIDACVDNVLIDVKSASSYAFKRYKDGITIANDSFGYLEQLGFYWEYNAIVPKPTDKGFLWIDKQNGTIKYTPVETPTKDELESRARNIIQAVGSTEELVPRGFSPIPYGKSGNTSLHINCAYCPYKHHCWRDSNGGKGLQGYYYNQGPVWFTNITRPPLVPMIREIEGV